MEAEKWQEKDKRRRGGGEIVCKNSEGRGMEDGRKSYKKMRQQKKASGREEERMDGT